MEETNVWFGAGLYVCGKPEVTERLLRLALIDKEGEVAGVQMEMIVTTTWGSERVNRPRQVTPTTLADLLKTFAAGRLGSIGAYDRRIDMNAPTPDNPCEAYLTFDINLGDNYDRVCTVSLEGPSKLYRQEDLIGYFRQIVCRQEVDYGCILTGLDRIRVSAVLGLIPQATLEEFLYFSRTGQKDHPLLRFEEEIGFYQSHRLKRHFQEWIPRANWATILSSNHAEKLGGEDRIRKESGCRLVERWGSNLYLQLTESLWDASKDELARLNHYFEPIRFPDAPEAVYL
ncbi:MAG: hypothetical protein Q7T82_03060 [Armatimonadota bacterium]|nr:hypothetical protein [Armatimonadota bacterium]